MKVISTISASCGAIFIVQNYDKDESKEGDKEFFSLNILSVFNLNITFSTGLCIPIFVWVNKIRRSSHIHTRFLTPKIFLMPLGHSLSRCSFIKKKGIIELSCSRCLHFINFLILICKMGMI